MKDHNSKFNAETARAAVERLVYRDKVKFILGDETTDAWLPITEANKVLVICTTPSPVVRSPKYKYVFQASSLSTMSPVAWAWFSEAHSEFKTVGSVFSDDLKGHAEAKRLRRLCEAYGQKIADIIFYPPDTNDFSAIATRLKTLNPDVFTTCAGGPVQDALSMKAMKQAGWNGQIFVYVTLSPGNIKKVISLDYVEGMLAAVTDTEAPTPTPFAKEFRDLYIAKYGKWDNPEVLHVNNWYLLIAALQQTQSLDTDKVAAHIAKGMKFVTPQAKAVTISRPDLGNPRAVDTLFEVKIGRLEKGKMKIVRNISLDEGLKYLNDFYSRKE